MISLAHWTPRYALDRARLLAYALTHPAAPWLAPDAVRFLDAWLQTHHVGFEWGAGRSTLWFAQRIERLTSIEHDERWYRRVQRLLRTQPRNNVDLRHVPVDRSHTSHTSHSSHTSHRIPYVHAIDDVPDASFDVILVDGPSDLRDACALAAIPKVRPGGILVIDDIHRYLPSTSRAPLAVAPDAAPPTAVWRDAFAQLGAWDRHTFSSGVTDTGAWMRAG